MLVMHVCVFFSLSSLLSTTSIREEGGLKRVVYPSSASVGIKLIDSHVLYHKHILSLIK